MILKQYYLGCLAHASYLVADEDTRTAAVIDPQRDVDVYLADAEAYGVEIRHVFLTHFHADFLAGHLELRKRAGAQIYLGSRAQAEYAFTPLADGANLEFGDVRLRAVAGADRQGIVAPAQGGDNPGNHQVDLVEDQQARNPVQFQVAQDSLRPAQEDLFL